MLSLVQNLKKVEDLVLKFFIDPDAIVLDFQEDQPIT